jgi:hypothetical protein
MSADYYAQVLYGIQVPANTFEVTVPNPLWGKCKFDPDTGEKVTEYITTYQDGESVAKEFYLDYSETTDGMQVFIGAHICKIQVAGFYNPEFATFLPIDVTSTKANLILFCESKKIPLDAVDLRYYLIGNCSY